MKWFSDERPTLFKSCIAYARAAVSGPLAFPKVSSDLERTLLEKLGAFDALGEAITKTGHCVYYHNAPVHWGKAFDFIPMYRVGACTQTRSSHLKNICLRTSEEAAFAICRLNSSLFYWFNWHFSNCRDLSSSDVARAPARLKGIPLTDIECFGSLCTDLMNYYIKQKNVYKRFSNDVITEVDSFYPMQSRPLLGRIDRSLATHFGMTNEEFEHVVNYDLKYRLEKNSGVDEDGSDL